MRAKLNLLSTVALGLLGGAVVGCQTYDFEPVEPLAIEQPTIEDVVTARALKPNIMMLVDTSGSMDFPTQCGGGSCPSRWTALQTAMQGFLSENGNLARLGLATYPGRERFFGTVACGATKDTEFHVALPADDVEADGALAEQAMKVNTVIQGIKSGGGGIQQSQTGGGTPTNASLSYVGGLPGLQGEQREDFILLLTDGLPNCNPDNANTGPSEACKCTQPPLPGSSDPFSGCSGQLAKLGCLDKDGSVAIVRNLAEQKKIKTIVIGFGAETEAGDGPATLNAMAEAGGFPRPCAAGETNCKKFYQAGTQAELAQALKEIIDLVGDKDPCLVPLTAEQRPPNDNTSLIVAYINEESLLPGADTWNLTAQGVQFVGAACERIKGSTTANPATIEIRVVRPR
ncbi:adventurous gliding motility lipoprotein CglB [Myxococcaceae bacterium GXIMD 01537]